MFIGHIRAVAVLLIFLSAFAFVTACSIHPTRGGEVGVYWPPDDDVNTEASGGSASSESDSATRVGDASDGATRVKDANTGWPDVPFETPQDAGQCIAEDYLAASKAQKPLAVFVMVDGTSGTPKAAPVWSMVLLTYVLGSPDLRGVSAMGFQFVGPDVQCGTAFDVPRLPIVSFAENSIDPGTTTLSMTTTAAQNPFPAADTTLHPTLPALQGAIQYAKGYAQSHPDYEVVLWLLTDGLPQGCDSTVENVAQAAADALSPPFPIKTFVLGIDASGAGDLQSLDQIAQNGGTEKATFVGLAEAFVAPPATVLLQLGSNPDASVFLDAVGEQWRSPLSCEYALPVPEQNERVDRDLINLYFTPNGGQKTPFYGVAGIDSCDPIEGGWYYNSTGTGLITCDKTCDTLKSTPGEVHIELGCPTIVL